MNLDKLKWDIPEAHHTAMIDLVKEHIEANGSVQLIQEYTRSWRLQSDSLLDHIWTNCDERTIGTINESRGASDHNVVGIHISSHQIKTGGQNVVRRMWKNFDEKECIAQIRNTLWSDILLMEDVDTANSALEDRINGIMDKLAPMGVVQMRTKYNCWVSPATKVEMTERDKARMRARISDSENDWQDFRRRRNHCTRMQRQDKNRYYSQMYERIENENDANKLFCTTKKLLGWQQSGPPKGFMIDGRMERRQKYVANYQADYYSEKVKNIKNTLPKVNRDPLETLKRIFDRWAPPKGKPKFNLKSATTSDVFKIIKNLKKSQSFGRDRIDGTTIKIFGPLILREITHVINLSLGSSRFPAKWKLSRIIPLLKSKGLDQSKPSSFRPVSQLPVLSKITERIVQTQLLQYMETSGLISDQHHAFRPRYSTSTALIQIMDNISTATDNNQITSTMNLDLSAAFDCVDHCILKTKLRYYGLDRTTEEWISSYLSHRSSYVVIGSDSSSIRTNLYGVPQGSVMGPLLYLIYVNEMPHTIERSDCQNTTHGRADILFSKPCHECGTMPMYADDGQYAISSYDRITNQSRIESSFWIIRDYLNANGLQINEGKTSLTEFMTRQKRTRMWGIPPDLTVCELVKNKDGQYKTEDKLICDSSTSRLLGINLKNCLTWDDHLLLGKKAVIPAVRRQLGMLSRVGNYISKKARLQLTNCLAMSRLQYMICLWGNSSDNICKTAQISTK